jgi:D-alanyl-D-alanine carboxypeptidase
VIALGLAVLAVLGPRTRRQHGHPHHNQRAVTPAAGQEADPEQERRGRRAVISTSDDTATWMRALVGGRVLNAEYQRVWLDSVQPEDPSNPNKGYGYGITRISCGPNTVYLHEGETPGYNTEALVDPANQMTLVVWANLTLSPIDGRDAANSVLLKVMDQIYAVSPLAPQPPTTTTPR